MTGKILIVQVDANVSKMNKNLRDTGTTSLLVVLGAAAQNNNFFLFRNVIFNRKQIRY